jgi:hypothetical protein
MCLYLGLRCRSGLIVLYPFRAYVSLPRPPLSLRPGLLYYAPSGLPGLSKHLYIIIEIVDNFSPALAFYDSTSRQMSWRTPANGWPCLPACP